MSASLADALVREGLLESQDETMPPIEYQDAFAGWKSQRGMLVDHVRTLAFRDAIQALVRPGDRVVDVGTGSGILAMFAAQQGASEVFALEVTAMAEQAQQIAERNGLSAMHVVRGDASAFDAGGPVDVVIGEFAGMTLLDEWRHFAAFVKVRDRNLRPGGHVIPQAGRLFLSAIDSRKLYVEKGYGFWEAPVYGLDFSQVRDTEIAAPQRYTVSADHNALVCTREVARLDFLKDDERSYLFETEVTFDYPAAGSFHGLIGHFELDLAPGLVLGTGTATRETCWHQSYFPMPALAVPAGAAVMTRLRTFMRPEDDRLCLGVTVIERRRTRPETRGKPCSPSNDRAGSRGTGMPLLRPCAVIVPDGVRPVLLQEPSGSPVVGRAGLRVGMSKPAPAADRRTDWRACDATLKRRRSRPVRLDREAEWLAVPRHRRSHPAQVPDAPVATCLTHDGPCSGCRRGRWEGWSQAFRVWRAWIGRSRASAPWTGVRRSGRASHTARAPAPGTVLSTAKASRRPGGATVSQARGLPTATMAQGPSGPRCQDHGGPRHRGQRQEGLGRSLATRPAGPDPFRGDDRPSLGQRGL